MRQKVAEATATKDGAPGRTGSWPGTGERTSAVGGLLRPPADGDFRSRIGQTIAPGASAAAGTILTAQVEDESAAFCDELSLLFGATPDFD
jgi:hypothetical protein